MPISFVKLTRMLCVLGLCAVSLFGEPPAWWQQYGVISQGASDDDYGLLNQGQLKLFALAAFQDWETRLPDGAGWNVRSLVEQWTVVNVAGKRVPWVSDSTDDYATVNLGQLKSVAKVFYDRMIELGAQQHYPWTGLGTDDFAQANVGQAKALFAFDLFTLDANNDPLGTGMPNWWKLRYLGNTLTNLDEDTDGDGVSNRNEYLRGTDPLDYFNGKRPTLNVVSGNQQRGRPGKFMTMPFVVSVTDAQGELLTNAPVTFRVAASSEGGIASPTTGAPAASDPTVSELSLRTDASGQARVYLKQTAVEGVFTEVLASVEGKDVTVAFQAEAGFTLSSPTFLRSRIRSEEEIYPGKVELSWRPVPDASTYHVLRQHHPRSGGDGGGFRDFEGNMGSDTHLIDTTSDPGESYTYKVQAIHGDYSGLYGTPLYVNVPRATFDLHLKYGFEAQLGYWNEGAGVVTSSMDGSPYSGFTYRGRKMWPEWDQFSFLSVLEPVALNVESWDPKSSWSVKESVRIPLQIAGDFSSNFYEEPFDAGQVINVPESYDEFFHKSGSETGLRNEVISIRGGHAIRISVENMLAYAGRNTMGPQDPEDHSWYERALPWWVNVSGTIQVDYVASSVNGGYAGVLEYVSLDGVVSYKPMNEGGGFYGDNEIGSLVGQFLTARHIDENGGLVSIYGGDALMALVLLPLDINYISSAGVQVSEDDERVRGSAVQLTDNFGLNGQGSPLSVILVDRLIDSDILNVRYKLKLDGAGVQLYRNANRTDPISLNDEGETDLYSINQNLILYADGLETGAFHIGLVIKFDGIGYDNTIRTSGNVLPSIEAVINGTLDTDDDIVFAVRNPDGSMNTDDPKVAADLCVTLPSTLTGGPYLVELAMKPGSPGSIAFETDTISLVPGIPTHVKMWGKSVIATIPSALDDEEKSIIRVRLDFEGTPIEVEKMVDIVAVEVDINRTRSTNDDLVPILKGPDGVPETSNDNSAVILSVLMPFSPSRLSYPMELSMTPQSTGSIKFLTDSQQLSLGDPVFVQMWGQVAESNLNSSAIQIKLTIGGAVVILEKNVAIREPEVNIRGTSDIADDFIFVLVGSTGISTLSNPNLAADLSITLPETLTDHYYEAKLSMKPGSSGAIKFERNSVSLIPGQTTHVKMWGRSVVDGPVSASIPSGSTIQIKFDIAGYPTVLEKKVSLLPVDVTKVWSDQIPGAEANFLPNGTGSHSNYNYIFMGSERQGASDVAFIKVRLANSIPSELQRKILWRFAKKEGKWYVPNNGASLYNAAGDEVTITVDSPSFDTDDHYHLVVGYDNNADGLLSIGEALSAPTYNLNGQSHDYELQLVSSGKYDSDCVLLRGVSLGWYLLFPQASNCLNAFLNESAPDGASPISTTIDRLAPGLDHPVGILFNPNTSSQGGIPKAGPGESIKATFSPSSSMSSKVAESDTIANLVVDKLSPQANQIREQAVQYFKLNPNDLVAKFTFQVNTKDAAGKKEIGVSFKNDWDLFLAIGHGSAILSVDVYVNRDIKVQSVDLSGEVTDIYDFDYGNPFPPLIAQSAASVQAGYNTLGVSGRVYKTEVKIESRTVLNLLYRSWL